MPTKDKLAGQIGDGPIEPRFAEMMEALARAIDGVLNGEQRPKQVGFCLLVFPFNDHDGRCNYISNGERKDMVVLLREQLARFEGMPTGAGHG